MLLLSTLLLHMSSRPKPWSKLHMRMKVSITASSRTYPTRNLTTKVTENNRASQESTAKLHVSKLPSNPRIVTEEPFVQKRGLPNHPLKLSCRPYLRLDLYGVLSMYHSNDWRNCSRASKCTLETCGNNCKRKTLPWISRPKHASLLLRPRSEALCASRWRSTTWKDIIWSGLIDIPARIPWLERRSPGTSSCFHDPSSCNISPPPSSDSELPPKRVSTLNQHTASCFFHWLLALPPSWYVISRMPHPRHLAPKVPAQYRLVGPKFGTPSPYEFSQGPHRQRPTRHRRSWSRRHGWRRPNVIVRKPEPTTWGQCWLIPPLNRNQALGCPSASNIGWPSASNKGNRSPVIIEEMLSAGDTANTRIEGTVPRASRAACHTAASRFTQALTASRVTKPASSVSVGKSSRHDCQSKRSPGWNTKDTGWISHRETEDGRGPHTWDKNATSANSNQKD